MKRAKRLSKPWLHLVAGFALLAAAACNFGPPGRKAEEKRPVTMAQNSGDPSIDLNCILARIQNPPEAFHYSYKHTSQNNNAEDENLDEEGDLTPQTIDGTFKNMYTSRAFHGVRSDRDSWQTAWQSLSAISGMSSTIALVHNGSPLVREGTEQVNGYDTIKYSIDTGRATSVENVLYRTTLGPGGFEKGTTWVTAQGCPVKMSLDVEMRLNNGSVEKEHYEEAMVKK